MGKPVKKAIIDEALEMGFELSAPQVQSIMAGDPTLVAEFKMTEGYDTASRDMLANALASLVGATEWPTYSVGPGGWNEFCDKVNAAAKAGKVKLADPCLFEKDTYGNRI